MAIGVIFIAGFGRNIQAVQADKTGNYIYGTFQCISEDGNRMRDIPCNHFYDKKEYGNQGNNALKA